MVFLNNQNSGDQVGVNINLISGVFVFPLLLLINIYVIKKLNQPYIV